MGKRGIMGIILVLTAIMAYTVYADHTASAAIGPVQIYETNTDIFDLGITNANANALLNFTVNEDTSMASIDLVSIATYNFTLLASTIPSDWSRSLANDVLAYATDYGAISSGSTQNFRIQATASKVDQNTTSVWTVTTDDLNNDTRQNTVQILIINDDTPPLLTGPLPYDGMYVKEGTNDQQTEITAVDNETGIKQINFNYDNCAYLNDTQNIILTENGSLYTGTADLSPYTDSTDVCFSFNAENNGGEMGIYSGQLTVDGFAPAVTLISPYDNALMNSQSDFEFRAEDNLAPNMTCELLVDSNIELSLVVQNNATTTISVANVSEGQHDWAVRCTDLAGWETTSETRTYTLDRTPPAIRLNSPIYLIIAEGTDLNYAVTDNFELDGVAYNYSSSVTAINKTTYPAINESLFTVGTAGWPEGINIVEVYADDAAGNNATEMFVVIVDKTAPNVTLISPINDSDVNANFTFAATDDYDAMLDCTLYVDNQPNGTGIVNTSQSTTGIISSLLGPADYTWRIECVDDAGNNGASQEWNVTIIDTTGPTIAFNEIGTVVRGNDIVINATITDLGGVDESSVYATMEDPNNATVNVTLTDDGSGNFIGSYPTASTDPLGKYIARVFALDLSGNSNSNYAAYNLTYAYVITMSFSPNPAETGQDVTLSGTVLQDDGALPVDDFITLALPGTTLDAAIDNATGEFTYMFSAPSVAGDYGITASLTASNGFTFSTTETLTVNNPPAAASSSSGGGGSEGSTSHNDGRSSSFDCPTNQYRDEDGNCVKAEEKEEEKEVSMPEESEADEHSSSEVVERGFCGDSYCDQNENPRNCALDCGEPEKTSGIGKAIGFLNLDSISSSLLWILLLIAVIMFVLVYVYQNGPPKIGNPFKKDNDTLSLEDYLEKRL